MNEYFYKYQLLLEFVTDSGQMQLILSTWSILFGSKVLSIIIYLHRYVPMCDSVLDVETVFFQNLGRRFASCRGSVSPLPHR